MPQITPAAFDAAVQEFYAAFADGDYALARVLNVKCGAYWTLLPDIDSSGSSVHRKEWDIDKWRRLINEAEANTSGSTVRAGMITLARPTRAW